MPLIMVLENNDNISLNIGSRNTNAIFVAELRIKFFLYDYLDNIFENTINRIILIYDYSNIN